MTIQAATAIPAGAAELTLDELSRISGGTFTKNSYSKSTYHSVGISTSYHFFSSDEFMFMGRGISHSQANELVNLANRVFNVLNEGYQGANQIGFSEKPFIRAFNSQLRLKYGIEWDGVPGHDY